MKSFTLLFALTSSMLLHAQTQNFEWATMLNGNFFPGGPETITDDVGNVYNSGTFTGTIDFDPGPGVSSVSQLGNFTDIFVSKTAPDGSFIWVKTFGGSNGGFCEAKELATDGTNIYFAGRFTGTIDFDPGPGTLQISSSSTNDIYLMKLNSNGDLVWVNTFEGQLNTGGLAVDATGNLLFNGSFEGTVDFDPAAGVVNLFAPASADNPFITKFDSNGNLLWAEELSCNSTARSTAITVDDAGSAYWLGTFSGTINLNPLTGTNSQTSLGGSDIFMVKLDASGNYQWGYAFGGTSFDTASDITFDSGTNQLVSGGYFQGTIDLDPQAGTANHTSNGDYDSYLSRYDLNGALVWSQSFGGTDDDRLLNLSVDDQGNSYVTGYYGGVIDMDPSPGTWTLANLGQQDVFVGIFNNTGALHWAGRMGGPATEWAGDIHVDNANNVYLSGKANTGTNDFDPTTGVFDLTSTGTANQYLVKLDQCFSSFATVSISACQEYISPSGLIYTNSAAFYDTIPNNDGCDSIIFIDLTLNTIDNSVTQNGTNLTANLSLGTYQWLDCDNAFSPIVSATNNSYTPATTGNYAVLVDDGICSDTSDCFLVDYTQLNELQAMNIRCYPNPFSTSFTIENNSGMELESIFLYSLSGVLLEHITLLGASQNLQIASDLPEGSYIIEIVSSEYRWTDLLIKMEH